VLFFVISELADVEPMYQYSLAWFVGLFEATLVQAEKARELHKRIDNLLQHFQYSLYLKVCVDMLLGCWLTHRVQYGFCPRAVRGGQLSPRGFAQLWFGHCNLPNFDHSVLLQHQDYCADIHGILTPHSTTDRQLWCG
jgi:hypothetical protein